MMYGFKLVSLLSMLLFAPMISAGGFSSNDPTIKEEQKPVADSETQGLVHAITGINPNDIDLLKSANLRVGGAVVAGVTYNPASPTDRNNGPVLFNDRNNEFQFNRFRLFAQRDIDVTSKRWDIGGRFDFVMGADARFTVANGLDNNFASNNRFNKVALPQFYAQVFAPYGNGITAQIGHFFTLLGSNSPFYSYTYGAYSEPSSHTGVLLSTPITDSLSVSAGAVLGSIDTLDNFDKEPGSWNMLSSATWTGEATDVTASVITGDDNSDLNGLGARQATNRTHATLVLNHSFAKRWHYKLQHDYGYQAIALNGKNAHWFGIEQDVMYDFNRQVTVGLRGEWFRDQEGLKIMFDGLPATYYGVTAGLFWKPVKWVTIRPELRYDISNNPIYNDLTDRQQFTFATSFAIRL